METDADIAKEDYLESQFEQIDTDLIKNRWEEISDKE